MPQSLAEIYLHIMFSTKGRHPFLHDRAIRDQVDNYLFGTCRNLGCPPLRVGGVEDHVHIACRLGKSIALKDPIKELERESSQWIKNNRPISRSSFGNRATVRFRSARGTCRS